MTALDRSDRLWLGAGAVLVGLAGVTRYEQLGEVTVFLCAGAALGLLALLVGRAVDQVGERLGSGATGVLQGALGNLPELFVGVFALRAGLLRVVEAAIVGSILGNVLLVLGLAIIVGGLRHGVQRFDAQRVRTVVVLMLLAVGGMLVPSLAYYLHTPAAGHEGVLSLVTALALLAVFAVSVPGSLRRSPGDALPGTSVRWPLWLGVVLLAVTGVLAGFVSDWFVSALSPAIRTLHVSQAFAGLVIVAIAGNAVEQAVGIQLAARNRPDYALSIVLNSPLQIALVLAPALVLLSHVIGGAVFTLVFPPLLVSTLGVSVVIVAFLIYDGESFWLEGVALVALYVVIATSFWWG